MSSYHRPPSTLASGSAQSPSWLSQLGMLFLSTSVCCLLSPSGFVSGPSLRRLVPWGTLLSSLLTSPDVSLRIYFCAASLPRPSAAQALVASSSSAGQEPSLPLAWLALNKCCVARMPVPCRAELGQIRLPAQPLGRRGQRASLAFLGPGYEGEPMPSLQGPTM